MSIKKNILAILLTLFLMAGCSVIKSSEKKTINPTASCYMNYRAEIRHVAEAALPSGASVFGFGYNELDFFLNMRFDNRANIVSVISDIEKNKFVSKVTLISLTEFGPPDFVTLRISGDRYKCDLSSGLPEVITQH